MNRLVVYFAFVIGTTIVLSGCGRSVAPPTPTPTYDYSMLPARTTPVPLTPAPTATPGGDLTVSFQEDILPLFEENCIRCHGGVAGLWLTDYEHTLYGGFAGPIVIPGNPEASRLLEYLRAGTMPPDAPPLPPDEVELVERWIAAGAPKN